MSAAIEIVSLGGAGGFGMNATLVAAGGRSLLVDCGIGFPHEGLPGVERLVPDPGPLAERYPAPDAIVLTHGHDDHVAALPWLPPPWREAPIYGTPLTLAIARDRFDDAGVGPPAMRTLACGDTAEAGPFGVELVAVNHSIPGSAAVVLDTPVGTVVFSGDVRSDPRPYRGVPTDAARLAELGRRGVRALFLDSTGARRTAPPGSESDVAAHLARAVAGAGGQVFASHFSSHVERLQAVLDAARAAGRRVALLGRRLDRTLAHATDLGLIDRPAGLIADDAELARLPPGERLFVAGGCQGEPGSSFSRLSAGTSSRATVEPGDAVVISARVIPGNAILSARLVDRFLRRGAEVLHADEQPGLHVSGHGGREELRQMIRLLRPASVIPNHGDRRHLEAAAALARDEGVPDAPVVERGEVLRVDAARTERGEAFELPPRLIDGSGAILEGESLRERRAMARAGAVFVSYGGGDAEPAIALRGIAAGRTDGRAEALGAAVHDAARGAASAPDPADAIARAVRGLLRRGGRRAPHVVVLRAPSDGGG